MVGVGPVLILKKIMLTLEIPQEKAGCAMKMLKR